MNTIILLCLISICVLFGNFSGNLGVFKQHKQINTRYYPLAVAILAAIIMPEKLFICARAYGVPVTFPSHRESEAHSG